MTLLIPKNHRHPGEGRGPVTPILAAFETSDNSRFRTSQSMGPGLRRGDVFAFALLALLPAQAMAQSDSEDVESFFVTPIGAVVRNDIVVTANGSAQLPERVGQAITQINADLIQTRQTTAIADLLSTTPGVTVSRNGGPGKTTAVRIRGAEGDQTLTLIDGVRVNDPSSPGGAFDFGNLLSGNISRIEVLRGPNSVPWGSQAIGGVVNIVTASPTDDLSGNARAEYGYKNAVQAVGQLSDTFGIVSASFGGGYFRDDGISAFKSGSERDGFRQYAANGKIGIALSDSFDLDFRSYYANSKTQLDGFPAPFFAFADTTEFSTTKELFSYAGANLRLFNDTFKNRIAFTLSDVNRDNFDAPGQSTPSFLARGRIERFEYQGDAKLSDNFRAVFGAEHETSRFNDGGASATTGLTSGYGQLIADIGNTLTLTGGARIDDHRDYGTQTTFSANAAWRPADGTIVRASYGEGFKAPTLFQLDSFFGNKALNPETAKSYDIGIEQTLINDTLTIGTTVFLRNTGNQIDFISCFNNPNPICINRPFGTYDNIKRTRAKGGEAFLRIRPVDTLTFDANYSLIDSKDRDSGLTLLRRPKHSVNVAVDWNARDWLKLGGSVQSVSDSFDIDFQTFNRISLDGYTLVSLRAAVPINDALEFYGRVENLFGTHYETVSGYGVLGRNAHVGVRAKF